MRILAMLAILLTFQVAGSVTFNSGCAIIEDFQEDILHLEAQPDDICKEEDRQCYMEDGESLGKCTKSGDSKINKLVCNSCDMCIGCAEITLGNICEEFICEVNEREIQANPGDPRIFASLVFNRVLDKKTCDELR